MKICLLAPVPPFRGGIAKYCYSLAQELEKRHDLLLLSYKRQYPKILYGRNSQVDPTCDVERISHEFKQLSYDIDSVNILSWLATSDRIIRFHPDLVILPWWVTYWGPMYSYLLSSLKKRGIRVVFLCINIFEHEDSAWKKMATRFVLRRVGSIIVHSEQEMNSILEINPGAVVKKHLLPLFTYAAEKTSRDIPAGLQLLFFGFVRPYKGLDILLKAIGILKENDISLRIAGEFWTDKEDYVRLIHELDIADKVEIMDGYLSDQDMGRCFSRADLVVLPYRSAITSGIIATAYGYQKPVLATNVGGFYEVVQDGYTGKLVPPEDPKALAEGIVWFLNNRREIDFAAHIAEFTAEKMSWRSLVDMIEKCAEG